MNHKILIVEDDNALRQGLERSLDSDNIMTISAGSISEARKKLNDDKEIKLVLLDCNLPDGNGIDFCPEVTGRGIPVIFLTVLDSELDEVSALRAGGVDYIRKPFSLMVLRERILAALRRNELRAEYVDERFCFSFSRMEYTVDGNQIQLSQTEQKLLRSFIENRGQILPRSRLVEILWSCDSDFIDENALSVTIRRLRTKLGDTDKIKTVYGLGYVWKD
ncbi:MAG: response regulator transcription factor [Clostridiales bacterium]|nr:response regulator transcription factor [Clostridiales bacterium]